MLGNANEACLHTQLSDVAILSCRSGSVNVIHVGRDRPFALLALLTKGGSRMADRGAVQKKKIGKLLNKACVKRRTSCRV